MVRSIASASGALAAVGLTVLLSYRLSLLGGLLVCWQVWGMMSRSLTRRVTLTSFEELNSWWSREEVPARSRTLLAALASKS